MIMTMRFARYLAVLMVMLGVVLAASVAFELGLMLYLGLIHEGAVAASARSCVVSSVCLIWGLIVGLSPGKNNLMEGQLLLEYWMIWMAWRGDEFSCNAMKAAVALVSDHHQVRVDVIWWVKVSLQYVLAMAVIKFSHWNAAQQVRDGNLEEGVVDHERQEIGMDIPE